MLFAHRLPKTCQQHHDRHWPPTGTHHKIATPIVPEARFRAAPSAAATASRNFSDTLLWRHLAPLYFDMASLVIYKSSDMKVYGLLEGMAFRYPDLPPLVFSCSPGRQGFDPQPYLVCC